MDGGDLSVEWSFFIQIQTINAINAHQYYRRSRCRRCQCHSTDCLVGDGPSPPPPRLVMHASFGPRDCYRPTHCSLQAEMGTKNVTQTLIINLHVIHHQWSPRPRGPVQASSCSLQSRRRKNIQHDMHRSTYLVHAHNSLKHANDISTARGPTSRRSVDSLMCARPSTSTAEDGRGGVLLQRCELAHVVAVNEPARLAGDCGRS
jgi:hypothetical protein